MNEKIIERAGGIIAERSGGPQNFCTLTFVDLDGYPHNTTTGNVHREGVSQN